LDHLSKSLFIDLSRLQQDLRRGDGGTAQVRVFWSWQGGMEACTKACPGRLQCPEAEVSALSLVALWLDFAEVKHPKFSIISKAVVGLRGQNLPCILRLPHPLRA
jgi:hypothetical protein